jgi:hypothetical protein
MLNLITNTVKMIFAKLLVYLSLIDDIIVDFLGDLKSLRYWLVIMAWIFNFYIAYAVIHNGLDWKALTVSGGFLTIVYTFWFTSKHNEAMLASQLPASEDDPKVDRDPDNQ